MSARFALVDCNNFYASCERVFNPLLIGKPVVVLSNNDGCVIARSEEAKQLGIEMGAPAFKNEAVFRRHKVQVFSSNFALYGDMSARVMSTLRQTAQSMEIYSIDEAFLGIEPWQGEAFGRELRARVRQWTGIPVSVGIAQTKTLAKLANRVAKKNPATGGVFDFTTAQNPDRILGNTKCVDLWGIGKRLAARLEQMGICTALELKQADFAFVRRELGVMGERMARELNGISCLELEEMPAQQKGVATARAFGRPVTALEELEEALSTYTARVAEKLRESGLLATQMEVFLATNPFNPNKVQYNPAAHLTLPQPTNHTPELISAALHLLRRIYATGYEYKKTGVFLTELVPEESVQLSLFGQNPEKDKRRDALESAVDELNRRLGRNTIQYGIMGTRPRWGMNQQKKSRGFTTRWSELLEVNAE